ncbi:MAG: hypothetical protein CMK09_03015 [Ponticaulis sp.]|nr:hypothetical protein [Ponticaulis sp.]|tara:strand:- start:23205 stop:23756 length:552 start_codon:yes stop_codon:yes gene_type:complete
MRAVESSQSVDEDYRLAVLQEMGVLDTEPEIFFEDVVDNIRDIFKVPVSIVSFIDRERQFLKARRGLELCTTSRDISICSFAMFETEGLMLEDTSKDPRFRRNPLVREDPGIAAYLGVPIIVRESVPIGAVAAIDFVPRSWTITERNILKRKARQLSTHIEMRASLMKRPPRLSGRPELVSSI